MHWDTMWLFALQLKQQPNFFSFSICSLVSWGVLEVARIVSVDGSTGVIVNWVLLRGWIACCWKFYGWKICGMHIVRLVLDCTGAALLPARCTITLFRPVLLFLLFSWDATLSAVWFWMNWLWSVIFNEFSMH